MFIGSVFHTIKGGIDSVAIRQKIKECQNWLSRDELALLKPYERYLAQERLLLTEFMIRCSQLKAKGASFSDFIALKERMNQKMADLIQTAQQELESHPANKLDVAQLVSSIQQLSIATDKDLHHFKEDLNHFKADLQDFKTGLNQLKEDLQKDLNHHQKDLHKLREEQRKQNDSIAALEKELKSTASRIEVEAKKINQLVQKRFHAMWWVNIIILTMIALICWYMLR